ncbi:MAG: hypothetical protein HY774_03295 [Acidobacteria bacterium]|nr:hypothetical protein [Acidobacteriota bacterium]
MSHPSVPLIWHPRTIPLAPVGTAAVGETAWRLAERLLAGDDESLDLLEGVAGPDWLVVLGPEASLPWVDGVMYLGRDPLAPALLLPTVLLPSLPVTLVEQAFLAQFPALQPPLAVFPQTGNVISLGTARRVARTTLLKWLEGVFPQTLQP